MLTVSRGLSAGRRIVSDAGRRIGRFAHELQHSKLN